MDPISLKVVDISHHNCGPEGHPDSPIDFKAMGDFGVRGIIHKATQGVRYADPMMAERRQAILDAGHLFGAYDFNTGDPVHDQVDFFLETVKPDENTLCALDFEDNSHSEMSLDQAREYLTYGAQQLGRKFAFYSGSRFKQLGAVADAETIAFFGEHKFWLSEYGPRARMIFFGGKPLPWSEPWLWQFSGDGIENRGITVPGIYRGDTVDMNSFSGSDADLAAAWVA